MPKPAFMAMGDLHLDTRIWKGYPSIAGDACLAFSEVVNRAMEWGVPLVLLGDVFDTQAVSTELVQFFRREMDRCQEEGLSVYFIQGNHDRRDPPWCSAIHDHPVYIGDGVPVTIGGVSCVGFDYAVKDVIHNRLETLYSLDPCPPVVFLHQALHEALRIEGAWNCDLDWINPAVRLVVLGDIHKEMEFVHRGMRAVYTGVSHLRELPQRGPHACLLVNDDLSYVRIPLTYRPVEKFSLYLYEDVERLEQWLDAAVSKGSALTPLSWVFHTSEFNTEVARLRVKFAGRAIVVDDVIASAEDLRLVDQEIEQENTPDDVSAELPSAEELLRQVLDPVEDAEAFALVLALLATGADDAKPLDIIQEFGKRILEGKP